MADHLAECNSGKLRVDAKSFQQVWCVRCSRPDCDLAKYARDDPMAYRQATWRERYFGDNQADLSVPQFARIAAMDFPNLIQKAVRLEISARRGDWSVPEIEISDGQLVQASPDTTKQIEEAVRRLGHKRPQDTFPASEEYPLENEGDLSNPNHAPPSLDEGVSPEPVRVSPEVASPRVSPSKKVAPRPATGNAPDPGAVMIGGDPAPVPRGKPAEELDPWAPPPKPKHTVIQAGASLRFGSGGTIQVLDKGAKG